MTQYINFAFVLYYDQHTELENLPIISLLLSLSKLKLVFENVVNYNFRGRLNSAKMSSSKVT